MIDDTNEVTHDDGPDMDALFEREFTADDATKTLQGGLPPAGTYDTDPDQFGPMNVAKLPGIGEDKRPMLMVTGRVKALFKGEEKSTGVRFRLSPESRAKRDEAGDAIEGTIDSATKLWARAVKVYKEIHSENPTGTLLAAFLSDGRYRLRLWLPPDGEDFRVLDIYPLKKSRG